MPENDFRDHNNKVIPTWAARLTMDKRMAVLMVGINPEGNELQICALDGLQEKEMAIMLRDIANQLDDKKIIVPTEDQIKVIGKK